MELCAKHQGNIQYIVLGTNSVQLACSECRDELIMNGQQPDSCLLISRIQKIPEVLLSKITIEPLFKTFFSKILFVTSEDLDKTKNIWIKEFEEMKASLEKMIRDITIFFDHLIQNIINYRAELKRIIQFETLEQYIKANVAFQNFDSVSSIIIFKQRQNTTIQIEQKIQDYINLFKKESNDKNKTNIEVLIKDYQNKVINVQLPPSKETLIQLTTKFQNLQIAIQEKFRLVNPTQVQSCLLSNVGFQNTLTRITQNQNPNYVLVYQGSIDGLNFNQFWNKIQNKSKLLMIMKAKNNQCVFGGYTPCKWVKTPQTQFMSDQQGTSFLFIQTPNSQIQYYPIKNEFKNQAITVNQNFGPQFGKPDLVISNDFKDGQLNIGQHYFRDPKENYQSFFLGPKLEEIIECEVFEL
ncbi:unnamed protein product [Paramecium pentaurelia]|uniref:TLDc domain-containing protein n=1 Tax=Paramecium pentaurelia TaxID=43138 RepID=A0A8S1YE70_9CILI|nr:unnamed protein product [Paramecium pentaurelia]